MSDLTPVLDALRQLERHAARPRPKERPLANPDDLNAVDKAVAKSAARRLTRGVLTW